MGEWLKVKIVTQNNKFAAHAIKQPLQYAICNYAVLGISRSKETLNKQNIIPVNVESYQSTYILLPIYYFDNRIPLSNMADNQRSSAFRRLERDTTDSALDFTNLGFVNQMVRVMTAQNDLINKLLERQNMLCQVLSKRQQSCISSSGSDNKPGNSTKVCEYRDVNQGQNNSSKSPDEHCPFASKNNVKIIQNQKIVYSQHKVHLKNGFQDESNSSLFEMQSQSDNREVKPSLKKKQTETKNMVKNFAKAIFSYIKKNKDKTSRVLKYLGISDQEFMKVFEELRGHVHSISELRNLWTPEGNIYHKAFRILSCDYLRKKCLQRTFNSRVQNFMVHLKYRQRLLQGIKSPDQFTILKTS